MADTAGSRAERRQLRVCVIGAGAAGLAAAHFLSMRGYDRVVVIERSRRVGGKCFSPVVGGGAVDVGAVGVPSVYREVRTLAQAHGIQLIPPARQLEHDSRTGTYLPLVKAMRRRARPKDALAAVRYGRAALRHRHLRKPGFAGVPPELARPFSEWAAANGLAGIECFLELPITAFGYGRLDEIPAAYVLKYVRFGHLQSVVKHASGLRGSHRLAGGYQALWESVASRLDVRLGTTVKQVRRGAAVEIETSNGTFECDRLIITSPLDAALSFLDASAGEKELFSAVRYNDYHVTVCRVKGLPQHSVSIVPPPAPGDLCLLLRGWADEDMAVAYATGDPAIATSLERTADRLSKGVEALGGALLGIELQRKWRYFPHVSPDVMAAGYFDRLEALQGRRHTWLAGGLLAFESVEHVVRYSRNMIERDF